MKYLNFMIPAFVLLTTLCFGQSVVMPKDSASVKHPICATKVFFWGYKINYASLNSPKQVKTERWKAEWGNNPLPCYGGISFRTSPIGIRQFKVPYEMWARPYDYVLLSD